MIEILCKLIGSSFVLASSLHFAWYMNKTVESRYEQLQMLYNMLNGLKGEIMYMGETLPESFLNLSDKCGKPINKWLENMADELMKDRKYSFDKIWSESLEDLYTDSCLEREDIDLLLELKDKLGSSDIDTQVKAIEYVLLRIEEKRTLLKEELKDKKRAIMSIGFFAGAMILIILL